MDCLNVNYLPTAPRLLSVLSPTILVDFQGMIDYAKRSGQAFGIQPGQTWVLGRNLIR